MKRFNIFIFALFSLVVLNNYAGEKEQINRDSLISKLIIIHPFGTDTVLKNVKYGDRIKYKICNVNTFKVNASVKSEGVDYDFKEISGFLEKALKSTDNPKEFHKVDEINEIEKIYLDFINISQKIMLRNTLEDILFNQIYDSVFIRDIDALKGKCNSEYLVCYNRQNDVYSAKKDVQTSFEEFDISYFLFKKEYDDILIKINAKLKASKLKDKEGISESKNTFINKYSYADSVYNKLKDFKTRNGIIKKSFAGIDLYNRIQKEEFAVYTESEPAMSDEVTFRPTLKNYKGETLKEFAPFYIKTTGRMKVNFSTGYLLSFISDDNFSEYTILKDSIIGVRRGNSSKITHALGALVHVYCTNAGYANFALSTGVSLTNNTNFGFYFGTTGLFQEKNRLALTAGVSFTPVKRINTSNLVYNRNFHTVVFNSTSDNEIKYDLVYRASLFIGVTYNLSEK